MKTFFSHKCSHAVKATSAIPKVKNEWWMMNDEWWMMNDE